MVYENFGLNDISYRLDEWINYANKTQKYIDETQNELVEKNYWNNVGFNFRLTVSNTQIFLNTIQEDLTKIKKAIDEDKVFPKEVNLLKKIGVKSGEYNIEYGQSFKDDDRWKDYTDSDFKLAENIYARGRDFFVALQDAQAMAYRLEDYANAEITSSTHNSTQFINKINSETVNLQQGNHNVMTNNDLDPVKFEELITKLELNASESEKENLTEIIHALRQELNKPEPKKGKIESIFDVFRNIKGTAEFSAAMFSIWDFIRPLVLK